MFLLRRPTVAALEQLLERVRRLPLSYGPVGLARQSQPAGFRVGEARTVIGHGERVFARAVRGLEHWSQFDLGWAGIYPQDAPLVPGTTVAVVARHLGFWSVHACRIVYCVGDEGDVAGGGGDRAGSGVAGRGRGWGRGSESGDGGRKVAGFAYGTLTEHAETGEEIFEVSLDPTTGAVIYSIRAVSRERALLAKLGFPVARAFQHRFRRDSLAAMHRYVTETPK